MSERRYIRETFLITQLNMFSEIVVKQRSCETHYLARPPGFRANKHKTNLNKRHYLIGGTGFTDTAPHL